MKRWHETRALTNPNGTHFHCQQLAAAVWRLIWRDKTKVAVEAFFFFSCCKKKQKQIKKKWTALSFARSACLSFHNVILSYSLSLHFYKQFEAIASRAAGKRPSLTLPFCSARPDHHLLFDLEPVLLTQLKMWLGLFSFFFFFLGLVLAVK